MFKHNLNVINHGMLTVTLSHIPIFGKVRVIYTEGVNDSGANDGIKEYTLTEVISDPALYEIKRRIHI